MCQTRMIDIYILLRFNVPPRHRPASGHRSDLPARHLSTGRGRSRRFVRRDRRRRHTFRQDQPEKHGETLSLRKIQKLAKHGGMHL